jgi:hypothetical protein
MKRELILCTCGSNEHQIILTYFDDEDDIVYVSIHLASKSFWERVILGMKYIFGYKCKYGHWEEFYMGKQEAEQLQKFINLLKEKK